MRPSAALPVAALSLLVAGCSSGSSKPAAAPVPAATTAAPSSGPAPATSAAPTAASAAPTSASAGPTPASAGPTGTAPKKVPLNATISDPVLGDTITVTGLVRSFPIPTRLPALQGARELVLVDLTLHAGSKYTGGLSPDAFMIVTADGGADNGDTTVVEPEMTKAGYKPLADQGVHSGQSGSGWVAFEVSPLNSPTLTLRYKRDAATVIGSGATIPAKTFNVPLTK